MSYKHWRLSIVIIFRKGIDIVRRMTDNACTMIHEKKLAIRIPKDLKKKIEAEARSRFISVADVVREAVIEYLNRNQKPA
jgi:Ribbon-helix-helix protein, copG family